jgi:hypothetical protein
MTRALIILIILAAPSLAHAAAPLDCSKYVEMIDFSRIDAMSSQNNAAAAALPGCAVMWEAYKRQALAAELARCAIPSPYDLCSTQTCTAIAERAWGN